MGGQFNINTGNNNSLTCDKENIFNLSKLCVDGSDNGSLPCLLKENMQPYHTAMGVWAIFVVVFAVLGNLLTLLAVPYAARKKR